MMKELLKDVQGAKSAWRVLDRVMELMRSAAGRAQLRVLHREEKARRAAGK